jgi:hypothetical protein
MGSEVSSMVPVTSGVIQGSVIGPLLFVLFVNDLPDAALSAITLLYADDLKLFRIIRSIIDCQLLQSDIKYVSEWAKVWLMPLSLLKLTHFHIGSRVDEFIYYCDNLVLKHSNLVKDLGVMFNENCNFRSHYDFICKRAHALCGTIFRSFEGRNPNFLFSLFNIYVRPTLEYASVVWSPMLKIDIASIEHVQRAFTKRIPSLRDLSYVERLHMLNGKSLAHRRIYFDLIFLYKIVHGLCSVHLSDIGISPVVGRPNLRNFGFGLKPTKPKSSLMYGFFAYRACKVWNALPHNVQTFSLTRFKQYIYNIDLVKMLVTGH